VAGFFLRILASLPVFFLWLVIVSLLVRPFGVRLPLAPFSFEKRSRALEALTFSQYLLVCGVLWFGCGTLIATTFSDYLEWKYWHGSPLSLTYKFFHDAVFSTLFGGVLFGLMSWSTRSGKGNG